MAFQERQLAQIRPAATVATSTYSPDASTTAIIKSAVVCNQSGGAATFRIFVDDDGSTYDEESALYWDVPIAANTTIQIDTYWPMNDSTGGVGFRSSVASALTLTLFGVEIT